MSSYKISEEVQEMLDNRIVFDKNLIKRESIKSLVQSSLALAIIGGGIFYMYRGKVKELEDTGDVEVVEVYVDEHNNVIDRSELEKGIYSIDLDSSPNTTIIDDGELHVIDPETYRKMSPVDIALKASANLK